MMRDTHAAMSPAERAAEASETGRALERLVQS
jgi:hypothetical protein